MRLSQNYGNHYGVPVIRIILFWGLYWGHTYFGISGKYHMEAMNLGCWEAWIWD